MRGAPDSCMAVIRLRGSVHMSKEIEESFKLLHLNRKNHATLVTNTSSLSGSLQKLKDYLTWGEVSQETLKDLLGKRGRTAGRSDVTDEYVKDSLGYESLEALVEAILDGKEDFWKIKGLKPVFRLRPPKGGFDGKTKKPYPEGELGYRGSSINDLLAKMI